MKSVVNPAKWTFKALDLSKPKVMGILNLTPDSFFDGNRFAGKDLALGQAVKMLEEGASIIDIGAVSSRPFAQPVGVEEEWKRLEIVLVEIRKQFPDTLISVDTYQSPIAERAIDAGADFINDISGGLFDAGMFAVIARHRVPYILMHIRGNPQNMQQNPTYDNVIHDVENSLTGQLRKLADFGIEENIILDPGFGFGKTVDHNYQLLGGLKKLKKYDYPILAGLSRKSLINQVLGTKPENALNGTTAVNMLALMNGADILRVHDVKEAIEAIRIYEKYYENNVELEV